MRVVVLNGGTGTVKAALATVEDAQVRIERRATVPAEIRRRVAAGLGAWNVGLDPERNAAGVPGSIALPSSRPVYVIPTDEESLIAAAVARRLQEGP